MCKKIIFERIISLILAVAVFTAADFCYCKAAVDIDDISAECAVLYCVNNGEVLFEKNAGERRQIASTTKIMTSLLACESGELSREIKVTDAMTAVEGTSMGLMGGDTVTLRALVCGMLLESGNDAANTTAIALAGSVGSFCEMMNKKASELGMDNTQFMNPSGLTQDGHYSTAYDMALLASAALRNEVFSSVCSEKSLAVYYGNPPYRRVLSNHNRLLSSYEGANGIKTGFTKAAGRCLVSSAERDGITLVAVTLNAPDDWNDHRNMLDYGFSVCSVEARAVDYVGSVAVTGGQTASVAVSAHGTAAFAHTGVDINEKRLVSIRNFLYAPVKKGDVVGTVSVFDGECEVGEFPIIADSDCGVRVYDENKSFGNNLLSKIKDFFKHRKDQYG